MSPPALTGTLPGECRAEADMHFRPVHTSIWKAVTMHGHRIAVFGLVRVFRVALGLSLVSAAAERPTAFRGIRWGTSIRAIPGLQVDPSPPHAAQDVTADTRAADDRTLLGVEAEAIRYLATDDQVVGVAIQFRQDRDGRGHCEQAMRRLGEIYGAPDQRREIDRLPAKTSRRPADGATPTGAVPRVRFATVHRWFATRETDANLELMCPAQAESFPGSMRVRWVPPAPPRDSTGAATQLSGVLLANPVTP